MPEFTAKDVQGLRQATGAGMMDAKKALQETDGDLEAATQWLREKGLAKAAKLGDRENTQGAVAVVVDGNVGAIVELKSETDFSAKADDFTSLIQDLAELVLAKGTDAVAERRHELEDLKITKKENIELGQVVRFEAAEGNLLDSYLHMQDGRGVNAVLVELAGGTRELAHDIAVHIAFAKPTYLTPRRGPRRAVERSARPSSRSPRPRASPNRPGPRSSRAGSMRGTRSRCCSSRASSATTRRPSPSCSAPPRWCGSPRCHRLRDGAGRRPWHGFPPGQREWPPRPVKLSGEAFAGEGGYGIDGASSASWPARSSRSARTSTSTWPSWSAAATSGGA